MKISIKISPHQAALTGYEPGIHKVDVYPLYDMTEAQRNMLARCLGEWNDGPVLGDQPASPGKSPSQVNVVGRLTSPTVEAFLQYLDGHIEKEHQEAQRREENIEDYVQGCVEVFNERLTRERTSTGSMLAIDNNLTVVEGGHEGQLTTKPVRRHRVHYKRLEPDWPRVRPYGCRDSQEADRRFWERVSREAYDEWRAELNQRNHSRLLAAIEADSSKLVEEERTRQENERRRYETLLSFCYQLGDQYGEAFKEGSLCQRWVIYHMESALKEVVESSLSSEVVETIRSLDHVFDEEEDPDNNSPDDDIPETTCSEVECVPGGALDAYREVRNHVLPALYRSSKLAVSDVDTELVRVRVNYPSGIRAVYYAMRFNVDCGGIDIGNLVGFYESDDE